MNPVEEGSNQFSQLFEKMPAKRIGKLEDVAGAILYLCSQAGVSVFVILEAKLETPYCREVLITEPRQAYVDGRCLCVDGGRVLLANGQ